MEDEALVSNMLIKLSDIYQMVHKEHFVDVWQGELKVLVFLAEEDKDFFLPSELGKRLSMKNTRIAATLNSLEKKGLIHREMSHIDRRKILVNITEEGRLLVKEKQEAVKVSVIHLIEKLGNEDSEQLNYLLGRIADIFHEKSKEGEIYLGTADTGNS